jgi:LCP family protein required for cell wall assembly
VFGVVAALAAVVLVLAGVYYALYRQGRSSLFERNESIVAPESLVDAAEDEGQRITYQGENYRFNDAVVSMLFMGVDKTDIQQNDEYGRNGQADSLFVATLDTKTGEIKVIPLSREIMVDVNTYAVDGSFVGTQNQQLCLAYAYGATGEESSENVIRSVKRLLYGMPIDGYVTLDMDGGAALTDAVGGVKVTALESITKWDGSFITKKGSAVVLNSDTVLRYICTRDNDVDANNRRMQRQRQFLNEFIKTAADKVKKNFTLLERYYNAAKPYTVSDLSLSEVTYLASTYLVGGQAEIRYVNVTGEMKMGKEHVEFYPDQTSLYEAVLAAFYIKEE